MATTLATTGFAAHLDSMKNAAQGSTIVQTIIRPTATQVSLAQTMTRERVFEIDTTELAF